MQMHEWVQILGSGGIGVLLATLLTTILNARSSVYKNLNDLVDQLQEDREADRLNVTNLTARVNIALSELYIEREYSAALYLWGMAGGAQPPPPMRRTDPT